MRKGTKILLLVSACMVVAGCICAITAFLLGARTTVYWGSHGIQLAGGLSDSPSQMSHETIALNQFDSMQIRLDGYQLELVPSDRYYIELTYDNQWGPPAYGIENGQLNLSTQAADHGGWFNSFRLFDLGFSSRSAEGPQKAVLYYPADTAFQTVQIQLGLSSLSLQDFEAGSLDIDLDLGDLDLQNVKADRMHFELDTGMLRIDGAQAGTVEASCDLGSISILGAVCDTLTLDSDLGEIQLDDCQAGRAVITQDTGQLEARDLSTNGLEVDNDSGGVVLRGSFQGTTEIYSDLGEVRLTTSLPREDYSYDLSADLGSILVDGMEVAQSASHQGGSNLLVIEADGGIELSFGQPDSSSPVAAVPQ